MLGGDSRPPEASPARPFRLRCCQQAEAEGPWALVRSKYYVSGCAGGGGARFEWVDGALTRAVEDGGWVLLRGANLAAPAVLDRLNRCVHLARPPPRPPHRASD